MKTIESDKIIATKSCYQHGDFQATGIKLSKNYIYSECPKCLAKSEAELKKQEQAEIDKRQKEKHQAFLESSGLPKRYWGKTLTDIIPAHDQKRPLVIAKRFVEVFGTAGIDKCLIFFGGVGTGKTMIATAILQALGVGKYIRAIDVSRIVRSTYGKKNNSELKAIQSLAEPELLVIDEVGIQLESEHESILITDLIDRRHGDLKPTIICSNENEERLEEIFGARVWSRIMQNAVTIPVLGPSQRDKHAA